MHVYRKKVEAATIQILGIFAVCVTKQCWYKSLVERDGKAVVGERQ